MYVYILLVSYKFLIHVSQNIPQEKVASKDFLEPCKAIATLQIARDLRNDAAVQLSSLLSHLPEEVKEIAKKAQEHKEDKDFELAAEEIDLCSRQVADSLLDMNLEEQITSTKTFQDLILRQSQARQKMIFLMIQSRCQFGSNDVAKKFMELEEASAKLEKRKAILVDAMALEGLEADGAEEENPANELKDLPPLDWYKPGESDSNKRQKLA